MMGKRGEAEVFRITGARQGLADDVRGRQRRYVISMSVRTVAVILAAVLWNVERHVSMVALALGLLLPYVAVVIANAGRENTPSLPSTFVPAPVRPALETGFGVGTGTAAGRGTGPGNHGGTGTESVFGADGRAPYPHEHE
ncbi:DUF3099 domain-containing protein [Streptomyces sp. NPDC005892]|uniref:DUF3099 domain-containing protein n=1 Tax=Streptomyces sp. NPDC005892 TaxID=3155593 RepID=UPI003402E093